MRHYDFWPVAQIMSWPWAENFPNVHLTTIIHIFFFLLRSSHKTFITKSFPCRRASFEKELSFCMLFAWIRHNMHFYLHVMWTHLSFVWLKNNRLFFALFTPTIFLSIYECRLPPKTWKKWHKFGELSQNNSILYLHMNPL